MSHRRDSVLVSSLGKGDSLHQEVLASFPLCQTTEEDLIQNPLLCKLLATLSQHVDPTGLTQQLRKDLEKAERELHTQRLGWLRVESVHRVLQEILQENHFSRTSSTSADEEKFYSTLEQCVLVAQCVRLLDSSSDVSEDHAALLGLSAERLTRHLPDEQEVLQMKHRLPSELLKYLKKKAGDILSYYQPDWENESEGLWNVKLSKLPELLDSEQKKAKSLSEKNSENITLLQRQTHAYLSELLKCMKILQCLILDLRLKAQKDLDRKKIEYFEAKWQRCSKFNLTPTRETRSQLIKELQRNSRQSRNLQRWRSRRWSPSLRPLRSMGRILRLWLRNTPDSSRRSPPNPGH
ncbi:HAUS augmin-like complex subunit 4 isoform X2 [Triplophysa dalaica]|uniref:HAUS augmin-like complex subunit 4 isoform X2 n=1 Tax=Triplophysa dalaica TaxID=1582913 RepID=UPI0024DFCF9A|nr:HAUS augmin-like complex subunit 4 isoform X2 [Triplophysa dalaica]